MVKSRNKKERNEADVPRDEDVHQWSKAQRDQYDWLNGKAPLVEGDAAGSTVDGERNFVAQHAINQARGFPTVLDRRQHDLVRGAAAEIDEVRKWVAPVKTWVAARVIQERAAPIALRLLREYESMYGLAPAGLLGTLVRGVEEGMQCIAEIQLADAAANKPSKTNRKTASAANKAKTKS